MNKVYRFFRLVVLCFVVLAAKLYRVFFPELWLMASRPDEADGNALIFYNWARTKKKCVFILNKEASQYQSGMIKWGGWKHVFYSAAASVHVFDGAGTCNYVGTRTRELFGLKLKEVFLQHGVIRLNVPIYRYEKSKYDLFIVSAKKEYEFVHTVLGYPKNCLAITGLARHDDLLQHACDKGFILIMPTWRRELAELDSRRFIASEYYVKYQSLLNGQRFQSFLKCYGVKVRFQLHYKMRDKQTLFSLPTDDLIYSETESVHELLRDCSLLITDCSSVAFDVALAGKPVIYYSFLDEHYSPEDSNFQLEADGFGPVVKSQEEIIDYMHSIWENDHFQREKLYSERSEQFFAFHDTNNCQRIFDTIEKLEISSKMSTHKK